MQQVTCWYKYNPKKDLFEFNHIEDGEVATLKPLPKGNFPLQNDWKNYTWFRTYCTSRNGELVNEYYMLDGVQIQSGTPEFDSRLV